MRVRDILTGRAAAEHTVDEDCAEQYRALEQLTFRLGAWRAARGRETPAGGQVDAAIAEYFEQAGQAGRNAGVQAGWITAVLLAVGIVLGAFALRGIFG
jgi:hypothetical protein